MNWQSELKEIEDRLLPHFQCDIWERGLYYYLLRRTHLNGEPEHTRIPDRCTDESQVASGVMTPPEWFVRLAIRDYGLPLLCFGVVSRWNTSARLKAAS